MTDLPSQCDAKILSMTSSNMLVRLVEEVRWFAALPSGGPARITDTCLGKKDLT